MKTQKNTYLSLGSNQGDRLQYIQKAINAISEGVGRIQRVASVYKSRSWGFKGADFYNTCIKVSTSLSPDVLMKKLLKIERDLGRVRSNSEKYTDRKIDLDILLFDDEIIFSKKITIPHPRMLERKFVLVPLVEIAKTTIHPIEKKQLRDCLEICPDSSKIEKISSDLTRPDAPDKKYPYIAIEGNIGAGKTSLANLIGSESGAKILLERFANNPFLPKFYQDKERFAFSLEISFLATRYEQLSDDLAQFEGCKNLVVSDYYVFKSLIFAQITLQKEEYTLYKKLFDILYKKIAKPDLYIYLHQNTDRLLENIKKRGRVYEQHIEASYLQQIHEGYRHFIETEEDLKALIIDVSGLDFINNPKDYRAVVNKIEAHL